MEYCNDVNGLDNLGILAMFNWTDAVCSPVENHKVSGFKILELETMPSNLHFAHQVEVDRLYALLQPRINAIRSHFGRIPTPRDLPTARRDWGTKGVYFFFETTETRANHDELRIVRIGSHSGEKSSIESRVVGEHAIDWGRSVFRNHLGAALIRQGKFDNEIDSADRDKWAALWSSCVGSNTAHNDPKRLHPTLHSLHPIVTRTIESMTLVWVEIADRTERLELEKQCIRLLSNYQRQGAPIDAPSHGWLGRHSLHEEVQHSGLWNVQHVKKPHTPGFLTEFQRHFLRVN